MVEAVDLFGIEVLEGGHVCDLNGDRALEIVLGLRVNGQIQVRALYAHFA